MTVTLEHHVLGVGHVRAAVRDQADGLGAQTHGAAHVAHVLLLRQQVDDSVRRVLVELPGVSALHAADVARELDDGALHAEADAEIRHLVLAAILDGVYLALDAAHAESAGDNDAVGTPQPLCHRVLGELL